MTSNELPIGTLSMMADSAEPNPSAKSISTSSPQSLRVSPSLWHVMVNALSILYFQVAIITEGGSELYIGSTVGPVAAYVGVSVEHEAHLRLMRDNDSRPLHVGIAPAVAVIRSASEDEHGGLTPGGG